VNKDFHEAFKSVTPTTIRRRTRGVAIRKQFVFQQTSLQEH